jgi:hypothetical protein
MAKTAIVNPRRRRKAAKKRRSNPRRRRHTMKTYGSARRRRTSSSRRRRNPSIQSAYSSGGYRQKNPDLLDFDHILSIVPAATGGIWAVRWALKMAGPFEVEQTTTAKGTAASIAVPGIKHAFAGVIAARVGSGMIANLLGDASKANIAEIAALGFLGDLFMRTRILGGSQWVADNLMLQGVDDCDDGTDQADDSEDYDPMMGAQPNMMVGPDGTLYQLSGGVQQDPAYASALNGMQDTSALGAMQDTSALGRHRGGVSGFGYR